MKVGELEYDEIIIADDISVEEASARLMNGEDFDCLTTNAILYHYGFYDEEAVCVDKQCYDCIFSGKAGGCLVVSSKYVRELVADKFVRRESIEMMI